MDEVFYEPSPAKPDWIYPLTIMKTRYGGVYEGGRWVAFWSDPQDVPNESFGDDITCAEWWGDNHNKVGVGGTPNHAVTALRAAYIRGEAAGWSEWRFGR